MLELSKIEDHDNQISLEISNKSIFEIIEDYLNERFTSENTKQTYQRYLKKYFESVKIEKMADFLGFPYHELRKVTSNFIMRYKSPNTKRTVLAAIRSFYEYLIDVYGGNRNPVPYKINLPPRQNKSLTKSIGKDDLRRLLEKLYHYRTLSYIDHLRYVLVLTMSTTSLRISEVLQINIDMVISGSLKIIQKRGEMRILDLPGETQKALLKFVQKYNIEGFVFQTVKGKKLSRTYAYNIIKNEIGLTCHSFRKSVIEALKDMGYGSDEIVRVTGHKKESMVNYYDTRDVKVIVHFSLAQELLK